MVTCKKAVVLLIIGIATLVPAARASLQNGPYEWPPQTFASFKACKASLDKMHEDSLAWKRTSRYSASDGWSDVVLITEGVKVDGASHAVYKETRGSIFTQVSGPGTVTRSSESTDSESVCDGRTMRTTVYQVANEGLPEQVDVEEARRQSDARAGNHEVTR